MNLLPRGEAFCSRAAHPPGWRNGRRMGLKIPWPKGRAGSSPAPGTRFFAHWLTGSAEKPSKWGVSQTGAFSGRTPCSAFPSSADALLKRSFLGRAIRRGSNSSSIRRCGHRRTSNLKRFSFFFSEGTRSIHLFGMARKTRRLKVPTNIARSQSTCAPRNSGKIKVPMALPMATARARFVLLGFFTEK